VVISTKAEGVPDSAPQMVRAVAVDASHVSVSWLPGAFPRGPVLSYVLNLIELPSTPDNHTAYSAMKVLRDSETIKEVGLCF
jgi:proto-oncogene tyrosine-protein kinase ROS